MVVDNLIQFYQGFSGPLNGLDNALLEHTVVEHARALMQEYLARHAATITANSPSLAAVLSGSTRNPWSFTAVWCPSFGILHDCLSTANPAPGAVLNVAVSVAWQLSCAGIQGLWSIQSTGFDRLTIDGWMLPPFKSVSIDRQQEILNIRGAESTRPEQDYQFFAAADGQWHGSANTALWPRNHRCGSIYFLTEGLDDIHNYEYLRNSILPTQYIAKAIAKHTEAMAFLTTLAPEYAVWVTRVLRGIIPLETKSGGINSGSCRAELGVIHASIDCPIEGYAEMLVHEATHQYFYILRRLGRVEDGSDPTLYFSPVKQTGRPIGMILLAYHAFANVVLLGRRCTSHALPSKFDYFRKNEDFLLPQLETLEKGLQTTQALTPLGTALWQPLQQQLCQTT